MFCTITPTRVDRPAFLEFCKYQLSRMTVKPDKSYFIDYPPISSSFDLVPRIRLGIEQAKNDGFDLVFIIEEDDWYGSNYFDNIPDVDFIGQDSSHYYNLRNNTHQEFSHPKRSSLFTTGFKISALAFGYQFPPHEYINLDVHLWSKAPKGWGANRGSIAMRKTGAIGIKHGIGKCGGRGHKMVMNNKDLNWEWLKSNVDQEAFIFYKTLKLT